MAKTSGLGDNFLIGGYDLSGDISALDGVACPLATLDVTSISKSAHERIGGLRDGSMSFTSFFEFGGAGNPVFEHDILSTLPRTDTVATYLRGTALGNPAACVNAKQIDYAGTRDNNGNLTFKVEVQANGYGLEWGKQLTAGLRTDGSATTGTEYDDGAGTSFGGQMYVQLTAFTGTSVTIDLQSSTTSGGTYATTGLTTSAMTAVGSQRVAVSNTTTINRYLEVVTSGTFTNAVFSVVFVRNASAVVF